MAINPDEDTEFNDALRKHGILPPKVEAPSSPSPPPSPTLASALTEEPSLEKLDILDETELDSDEERLINSYRQKRIAEMKKEMKAFQFGQVIPIGRDDYTREVTEASKKPEPDEDEKEKDGPWLGTAVVCFLYQEGNEPASVRLGTQLRILAEKYPRTKFTSIVGNKCIENYPDRHLPTLFLYRNGALRRQFVAYGKDRERSVEELEVILMATNTIDPNKARSSDMGGASFDPRGDRDGDSDEDLDDSPLPTRRGNYPSNRSQPGTGSVNHRSTNLRTGTVGKDDSDSDFDL